MTDESGTLVMIFELLSNTPSRETDCVKMELTDHKKTGINVKRILADVLLWCVLFVFMAVSMANSSALQRYSVVSLRYETPFSAQAAYRARQYSIEQFDEDTFWPTFWIGTEAEYSVEFKKITAHCIVFSGDASLVWPIERLIGGMPGVIDGVGCAISSGLAWELWGDTDVIGKTLETNGETRVVRSVFDETQSLALLSVRDVDLSQSFTSVELTGGPASPDRDSVERFAVASGLGMPDSILMGTPTFIAGLAAVLPLFILAIYGFVMCISWIRKRSAVIRRMFGFLMLLGAAMLLPGLLDILPDRLIPTQWSDFSFWGSLLNQTGDNLREYLELSPSLRDVDYGVLVFKQVFIAFIASAFALYVCLRLHARARIETLKHRIECHIRGVNTRIGGANVKSEE